MEDEESKRIAVKINSMERKVALDHCAQLGFTLANTSEVEHIKPQALKLEDVEVNFDTVDVGKNRGSITARQYQGTISLGNAAKETETKFIINAQGYDQTDGVGENYIELAAGEGKVFATPEYNDMLQQKLRRAIEKAEIRKEELVRERALNFYSDEGLEIPPELKTTLKTINSKGQSILENGTLETSKQERLRAKSALAEFNSQMRLLRKQAKNAALYAGLRKHAELTGKIPGIVPLQIPSNGSKAVQDNSQSENTSTSQFPIKSLSDESRLRTRQKVGSRNGNEKSRYMGRDSLTTVDGGADCELSSNRTKDGSQLNLKWNVDGLSGDNARKTKFLRLLGSGSSISGGNSKPSEDSKSATDMNARIQSDLEKQYWDGYAYKKDSKKKGLGS